ncbi:hypothetical protein KC19_12G074600 [Ceratodon purpureus]|uniref:Glycoside hydrolase family 19 catalytic domain-containing protein n=1 Tax=Ceratodon purpureus TaxID=3225 RepID=A0A8T0G8K2_CERPU|nr:hypothetical protein KC19_12G074600 [Ceratodon purpureus]
MTRNDLQHSFVAMAALVLVLVLLLQGASGQTEGSRWTSFVTQARFEKLFPLRNPFYTYDAFRAAASGRYPAFGNSGVGLDDRKRELAAFLANVYQETGGLKEIWEQNAKGFDYCKNDTADVRAKYPCAAGKAYIGRGPLQISWNYNYGDCGKALNLPLLTDPGRVASKPLIAFQTALWFWMSKGCHDAILRKSFSSTIRIINGGVECKPDAKAVGHQQMLNRVQYYKNFCTELSVDPGIDLEC